MSQQKDDTKLRVLPGTAASSGLTVYPVPQRARGAKEADADSQVAPTTPKAKDKQTVVSHEQARKPKVTTFSMDGDDVIPDYQKAIARPDGREDEDYYKDVANVSGRRSSNESFRSNPLGFMIRLSAESTAYYQGAGWRSYESYIGQPIFYPTYTNEMKHALLSSDRVKQVMLSVAQSELRRQGVSNPALSDSSLSYKVLNTLSVHIDVHERFYARQLYAKWLKTRKTAVSYIDSLIAEMTNKNMVRFSAFIVNNILVRMYNQGIHIKESEFAEVRKAAIAAEERKQSILFLPCHKSHVDYLVISYIFYRLGIALPHIAAGDNLNLPTVGTLLKHGGAFFIRRTFGDDVLYQEIVREYIELLLTRGHNIEVFIEGTRSRTGKLLSPKFGILKIALDAVLAGRVKDCIVVPMSIGYDKVIETETYVNELMGTPKEKESLAQILNSASILKLKLGRIDIRFAKPYSLRQWIDEELQRRSTPTSLFSPLYSSNQKSVLLQSLGFRVLSDINAVSVIMPTALVGTVILTLRGRGVGRSELIRRTNWLRREILIKGGRVADFSGAYAGTVVDRAVGALSGLVGIRKELLEPVFYAAKRFELSLYRNQIIHLFIQEAIVAASMYFTIKKGQTHRRIHKAALLSDIKFLSQLLKSEFIYKPGSAEENTEETLWMLKDHNVIDLEYEDGSLVLQPTTASQSHCGEDKTETNSPETAPDLPNESSDVERDCYIKLSDFERSIGRENFDFYCFLIWPFIETYWLVAASMFCLIPTPSIGGLTEKALMDRIQSFGKTLYYEGDLGYFESIGKETIKNAVRRYVDFGIVVMKKHSSTSAASASTTPTNLPLAVTLYSLNSDLEKEILLFWNEPLPAVGTAYKNIYSFDKDLQSTSHIASRPIPVAHRVPKTIYQTRLWDIVETIGKYRREGKHRRDNQITGQRTLRLARIASSSTQSAAL